MFDFSMESIIQELKTLDELSEWAKLWSMGDDELVKNRKVEILLEMASSSVFMNNEDMPACTES